MKMFSLILVSIISINAIGAGVPFKPQTDTFQVGKDASTDDKQVIFNVGDGASNPKIEVNTTDKKFELNKEISVDGNIESTGNITIDGNSIVGGDSFVDGDITITGGDVNIGAGDNKIFVDGGELKYTNDGIISKKIGSGSGGGAGGISALPNGSFEDGQGDWSNSGGTFTIVDYVNPSENNLKYARFVASAAGQYFQTPLITFTDDLTGACLAYIGKYKTADNNAFAFRLLDSSNNQIDSKTLASTNGAWSGGDVSNGLITFPCPSAGTQYRLRVISLAAGTIDSDLFYSGSENRLVNSDSYGGDWSADAPTPNMSGTTSGTTAKGGTPSVDYYRWRVVGQDYEVEYRYKQSVAGTNAVGDFVIPLPSGLEFDSSIPNSTGVATDNGDYVKSIVGEASCGANGGGDRNLGSAVKYSNNSFRIKVNYQANDNSFANVFMNATYCGFSAATMGYYAKLKFKGANLSTTQKAISQSQSEWMIDANIGGANASLSTTSVSSYTEITNASFDMVINSGSAPAKIPCTGTNPSTGLTCSAVNEGVGVVFNPPYAGKFLVCSEFSHYFVIGTGSTLYSTFQLVETENSSQVIKKEGNSKTVSGWSSGSQTSGGPSHPYRVCGIFSFSDTSEKTIRLMYEQQSSGTVNSSEVMADRGASNGQRDIHITVVPLKNGITPMKTGDTLTTPNADDPTFCSADISATGVISNQDGGCFASCTNSTTPVCTFTSGYYPSGYTPKCFHSARGAFNLGSVNQTTTTTFSGDLQVAGTVVSGARSYFCHGRRK